MTKPLSVDKALRQAKTLSRKGDSEAAQQVYEEILKRFPENARAQEGLARLQQPKIDKRGGFSADKAKPALALLHAGKMEEGLAHAVALDEAFPDKAFIKNLAGVFLGRLGRYREALEFYRKSIELDPYYGDAHCNIGDALTNLERAEEALPHLDKALSLMKDKVLAHNNMGNALNQLGRAEEALPHLRRAIDGSPDPAVAYNNMGNALNHLGQFEAAIEAYEAAVRHRPRFAAAHRNLSMLKTFDEGDPQIEQMGRILHNREGSTEELAHLAFALSKACEDIGKDSHSFDLLAFGNRQMRSLSGYTTEKERKIFAKIKQFFAEPPEPLPAGEDGPTPVFVLGMPRSGTSLVEQIIASHSMVFGGGEMLTLGQTVVPVLNEAKDGFDRATLEMVRDRYLDHLRAMGRPEPLIVDKLPFNFRWIGFVMAALPEAKVIHTRRDPMAVGWSIYKQFFPAAGMSFCWDLADIANYLDFYEDLMAFWHEKYPGRILDLQYEDLTENQEAESRRLIDHCGLEWEDACLDFHKTKRAVTTASAAQVRKKMYKGSSEAWRKYEDRLEPLLRRAG